MVMKKLLVFLLCLMLLPLFSATLQLGIDGGENEIGINFGPVATIISINGSLVDTNASTECSGDEVLLGDGTCVSSGGLGVGNSSFNESRTNKLYIKLVDEPNLNVNSSTWWAEVSSWATDWFLKIGNVLSFNQGKLNNTIELVGVNAGFNSSHTIDTDTNASTECNDGFYLDGSSICIHFNNTVLQLSASTTYYPTSFYTQYGTESYGNNIGNLSFLDNQNFTLTEAGGINAGLLFINFTGVDKVPDFVTMGHRYSGTHTWLLRLWDYNSGDWEVYDTISFQSGIVKDSIAIIDGANHVQNELVQISFIHEANGIPSETLEIDFLHLINGASDITTSEHDGLSGRDDIETNHPNAIAQNTSKNFITTGNITVDWLFPNRINFTTNIVNETQFDFSNLILTIKRSWLFSLFYTKAEVDNNLSLRLLATDQRYNETGVINANNKSWLSTSNATYDLKYGNGDDANFTSVNSTTFICNEIVGACDLTINHSKCCNATGTYEVG